MNSTNFFEVIAQDPHSRARVGRLRTVHGEVATPTFMPVGTQASIKGLVPDEVRRAGGQIILSNAYHLYLAPGADLVQQFGGVSAFMGWNGPMLTDSGGYQVSYMWQHGTQKGAQNRQAGVDRINDEGAMFISHLDGSRHLFTPERSIDVQNRLGADIIMAFDQPTMDGGDRQAAEVSVRRSLEWAARSREAWQQFEAEKRNPWPQYLFGIIQGGRHEDLRRESARAMNALDLPGVAIGGETIGRDPALTATALDQVADLIPREKPYYAMGLGGLPEGFFFAVDRGVDMFDNTSVTRMARNGHLFISPENGGAPANRFRVNLSRAAFRTDSRPVDPGCDCSTCTGPFTRAYLHHLFRRKELLAYCLATVHNIRFMSRLGELMRQHIAEGSYARLRDRWLGG